MLDIVVIGGIGSGKSSVSKAFIARGAAYIDLDEVGHDVLHHADIIEALVARFGADILDESGAIARPNLAKAAFADERGTLDLNEITHPRVISDALSLRETYRREGKPATIIEISPFDGPNGEFHVFTDDCDALIAVVAPLEQRVSRAVAKGFAEEDVRNRIARQVSDDQRRSWADTVIENDGTFEHLDEQVDAICASLSW